MAPFLCPQVWACWGKGRGPVTPTVALLDLADVLAVNPDSPASDPTVFHKRYLKKIRDLGEVRGLGGWGRPEVNSANMGGAWLKRPSASREALGL